MKYRAVGIRNVIGFFIRNVIGFFNGMVLYFTFYVTVFILEKDIYLYNIINNKSNNRTVKINLNVYNWIIFNWYIIYKVYILLIKYKYC